MVNGYRNKVCIYDKLLLLRLKKNIFITPMCVEFTIKTVLLKYTIGPCVIKKP